MSNNFTRVLLIMLYPHTSSPFPPSTSTSDYSGSSSAAAAAAAAAAGPPRPVSPRP